MCKFSAVLCATKSFGTRESNSYRSACRSWGKPRQRPWQPFAEITKNFSAQECVYLANGFSDRYISQWTLRQLLREAKKDWLLGISSHLTVVRGSANSVLLLPAPSAFCPFATHSRGKLLGSLENRSSRPQQLWLLGTDHVRCGFIEGHLGADINQIYRGNLVGVKLEFGEMNWTSRDKCKASHKDKRWDSDRETDSVTQPRWPRKWS